VLLFHTTIAESLISKQLVNKEESRQVQKRETEAAAAGSRVREKRRWGEPTGMAGRRRLPGGRHSSELLKGKGTSGGLRGGGGHQGGSRGLRETRNRVVGAKVTDVSNCGRLA
jgi:hypothetical protein